MSLVPADAYDAFLPDALHPRLGHPLRPEYRL